MGGKSFYMAPEVSAIEVDCRDGVLAQGSAENMNPGDGSWGLVDDDDEP